MTYNGWPTYETWIVNLWLTNDAATYTNLQELVTMCMTSDFPDHEIALAQSLHTELMEQWHDIAEAATFPDKTWLGFFGDMIRAAMDNVDWSHLAACYCEEWRAEQ